MLAVETKKLFNGSIKEMERDVSHVERVVVALYMSKHPKRGISSFVQENVMRMVL